MGVTRDLVENTEVITNDERFMLAYATYCTEGKRQPSDLVCALCADITDPDDRDVPSFCEKYRHPGYEGAFDDFYTRCISRPDTLVREKRSPRKSSQLSGDEGSPTTLDHEKPLKALKRKRKRKRTTPELQNVMTKYFSEVGAHCVNRYGGNAAGSFLPNLVWVNPHSVDT